jgi:hypothetical protein
MTTRLAVLCTLAALALVPLPWAEAAAAAGGRPDPEAAPPRPPGSGNPSPPHGAAWPDDVSYGVVAHVTRPHEHAVARKEFQLMKQAGIQWVQTPFDWDAVESPEGVWHFDHLDETVAWADAAGIRLLATLNYNVPWATPAHKHMDKWLTYVRKVVGRYRGSVRHWEVWNEPNGQWFWPSPSPADYAVFLKETSRAIKQIDPGLQVVFGGTYNIDTGYIEAALKAGARDSFDVVSVHPYGSSVDNIGNDIARLVAVLKRYQAAAKPIWITEWGWSAVNNDPREEQQHAVNLAIGWNIALHDPPVKRIFWYEFQSQEEKPSDREHYFGLVRRDLTPRPAYLACQALTRARPSGSTTDEGDWWRQGMTWPHWVRPDGRKGWAVWLWSGEADYRLKVRGPVVEAFDHLGKPLPLDVKDGAARVRLARAPIYVIGPEHIEFEKD